MVKYSEMLISFWFIVLGDMSVTLSASQHAPEHTLKRCTQRKGYDIICENFEPEETHDSVSLWPTGPYVIPMTRHGCPESSMYGWREGYLDITWKNSQYPHVRTRVENSSFEKDINVTKEHFFDTTDRHMFVSANQYEFKLGFCYKLRRNKSIDIGTWPNWNFSIYGTENGCPEDFIKGSSHKKLPNILKWDAYGFLPGFVFTNIGSIDFLQITLCSRSTARERQSNATDTVNLDIDTELIKLSETNNSLYWTSFFLIKNDQMSCPKNRNVTVSEETLYLEQPYSDNDKETIRATDTLCYFEIDTYTDEMETWMLERRLKNSYSVYISSIMEGVHTTTEASMAKKNYHWKVVDLGMTVSVSAVDITSTKDESNICSDLNVQCFISREKMDFLLKGVVLCKYVNVCRLGTFALSLLFTRVMEGRFVALSFNNEAADLNINVYTERIINEDVGLCNSDLGMNDMSINDDQLSASSASLEYTPEKARPTSSGWCPDLSDDFPYIEVTFQKQTQLEGLTLYNTFETQTALSAKLQKFVSLEQNTLMVEIKNKNEAYFLNKKIQFDTSRSSTQHTFWFSKSIMAESVSIVATKTIYSAFTCLRFELLGCKSSAIVQPFKLIGNQMTDKEVAFISEIHDDRTIITNIGYPQHYQTSQAYKWLITYPEKHYIKLVFTHIEFNIHQEPSTCRDILKITNHIADSDFVRIIDQDNHEIKHSLAVETKEIQIMLSFETCSSTATTRKGSGFSTYVTYENIPACFSLRPNIPWQEGSRETCRQSLMLITSMSYLGFQFVETTEQWTIHVPMRRIHLQIISFYVPCKNVHYKSEFKIIDMEEETFYCNINKPPNDVKSSYDNIIIYFYKGIDPFPTVENIEGFRIVYSLIPEIEDDDEEGVLINNTKISKARNVAINKPAIYPSFHYLEGILFSLLTTDGLTFPEQSSCLDINVPLKPWWLLDLHNVYHVKYLVIYLAIGNTVKVNDYNIVISTGLTVWELNQVANIYAEITPSRTIQLHDEIMRYIHLQQLKDASLTICEVKVYAEDGQEYDSKKEIHIPNKVHGEWGHWSPWSNECYCDGNKYRQRLCNNPDERFGGKNCPGKSFSGRLCSPVGTNCKIHGELAYPNIGSGYKSDKNDMSRWSNWGTCSSECGNGLITRRRNCNLSESMMNKTNCGVDEDESRPCSGLGNCLVCSEKFKKCYRIISKVTNWNQARLECWTRNMSLVSMLSLYEMRFIKYLLRKRRNIDVPPLRYFDAEYYVHIGLSIGSRFNKLIAIWENEIFASYFTAWNLRIKSSGNCTRMNFKLFYDNNTWEHEDCNLQLAEYLMCERKHNVTESVQVKSLSTFVDTELVHIPEQIPASEYNGNVSVTITGAKCHNTSCTYNNEKHTIDCEQSDGIRKECSVKLPLKGNTTVVYKKYLGTLNITFSGKTCQRWDQNVPHHHVIDGTMFKGEGISDAANYCRDPGDTGHLWCFTTSPETRWEPCLLNDIKAERLCIEKQTYTGTRNITITGKPCKSWDNLNHKKHFFSNTDIETSMNFCRDPSNSGFNWCYVEVSIDIDKWEPCEIEEVKSFVKIDENPFNAEENYFMCDDDKSLPLSLRCNGRFDCKDKVDEMDCYFSAHPMLDIELETFDRGRFNETVHGIGSLFRCKSNDFISVVAKCDGIIDCFDASDELDCIQMARKTCSKHQFQCDDGDCIHVSQVCNFKTDCIDGSDEYCDFDQCSAFSEYQCDNGRCILLEQRCDAVQHCTDGSDELACEKCQSGVAFHCDFGRCIPSRLTCDEYQHCEDGTDEIGCTKKVFDSCQDVWESGYRKSGYYSDKDAHGQLQCLFDEMEYKTIKTIFNFDFFVEKVVLSIFSLKFYYLLLYNNPVTLKENNINFVIYNRHDTRCLQQIKEVCAPSYETVARLNSTLPYCNCTIFNFDIAKDVLLSIDKCDTIADKKWTIYNEYPTVASYWPLRNSIDRYSQIDRHIRIPDLESSQNILGSAICRQDYMDKDDDFTCDINGKHIPAAVTCIYDMDDTGFPVGCRDGSHLNNCEHYTCLHGTLKCPNSYCIPQRFLCDGIMQCPGGEDEDSCGCLPSKNEILIIHDEETDDGPDIFQFAQQFSTTTNIVRVLSYKASKPLQAYGMNNILLDVLDKEINMMQDTKHLFECRYKIMAKFLLDSIHFTNGGSKGFILIQTKGVAEEVNNKLLQTKIISKSYAKIYRVMEKIDMLSYSYSSNIPPRKVLDINVRRWKVLNGIGAEYFSELCNIKTKIHCPGGYKCAWSRVCLTIEQVCDGIVQCLHGDDEEICDFKCPFNCTCNGFVANCSNIDFQLSALSAIPGTTRDLDLSFNSGLSPILEESNLNILNLFRLNLSHCGIKRIALYSFGKMKNIRQLDLSYNFLTVLRDNVFSNLRQLKLIILRGNTHLSVIEMRAFTGLSQVEELDLANAKLETVLSDTFSGMTLSYLDLSNNKIKELQNFAFRDAFIRSINFKGNDVKSFNTETFTGLIGLENLITPEFKFCCIRPNYVKEENCYPQKDEFSSCDDLMRHSVLQFLIWLIGITAFLGNILTILYRLKYDRQRLKLGFGIFVTNLAVADFLMAVYLIIIAVADAAFRKRYIFMDVYWRHSFWCNLAGILSTVSSESSVLFLCLITLDRFLVIKFPFGRAKLSKDRAVTCAIFTWSFSVIVAIFPFVYEGYFKNEFYSKSGVCIALPLTGDRPPGWVYSLSVFVCLNFFTFVLVAAGQLLIFIEIRQSYRIATSVATSRKRDLKVSRNLLLVVATDFMCWFPIGVMAMLALSSYVISGEVYAWTAVFILPVNSALNPILYTLSAIIGGKKFNPSTDEQSLKEIAQEIGENALRCFTAIRRVTTSKRRSGFEEISMIPEEVDVSIASILSICMSLTQTLDALHACSVDIRILDRGSLFVGVKRKKLTGLLRIKAVTFVSYKHEDRMEKIKELGMLIKDLIAAREKSRKFAKLHM